MKTLSNTSIDISKVPFSKYGSDIAVCHSSDEQKLTVHNARKLFGEDHILDLEFVSNGVPQDITVTATPVMANIDTGSGKASIYLRGDDALVIEGENIGLNVKVVHGKVDWGYVEEAYPTAYGVQASERQFKMIRMDARLQVYVELFQGGGSLGGPIEQSPRGEDRDAKCWLSVAPEHGRFQIVIQISPDDLPFSQVEPGQAGELQSVMDNWETWLAKIPEVPADHLDTAITSWYNIWSSFVRAEDNYHYDAMLMSKKRMCSVWSWDHCFNALCLASSDPEKAIEQFLLPFEVQAESGALPDRFNPNDELVWGVTKPPVHGWAFALLMDKHDYGDKMLGKVYRHLEKLTNWWMDFRDSDNDGFPDYPQGCDSGGDNYTIFDGGFFIDSPDLPAYLILQMNTLSRIAGRLNDEVGAAHWRDRSSNLLGKLLDHSWDGDKFVARYSGSHQAIDNDSCLILLLPIVLGDLLDRSVMNKLIERLERKFMTAHGPATEALDSPHYASDSYWRGPIWAPSTYLLADGLRRAGHDVLAVRIATSFCEMIRDKAGGNYENFDALTGEGLRAPGYTWTASVHMLFLSEYLLPQ